MGWCTTLELEEFVNEAGAYLRSRAAENTLLLSAVQAARAGRRTDGTLLPPGVLFGWWQPDGGGPRGAFVHDPTQPLLISGRVPEMAATLAVTLAKMGRQVTAVDAPAEVADAFAATWSQRAGIGVRVQRQCSVYRIARPRRPAGSEALGPAGQLRIAQAQDHELLAGWLTACAAEAALRLDSSFAAAADLISYGGAMFWEVPQRPVALVTLTRPMAGTVRITGLYTPPEYRHSGYASAITMAASHAVLAGAMLPAPGGIDEVIMITDRNHPARAAVRFGYQLVDERSVLRFGPVTGSLPHAPRTGPTPRLPTGPLPRLPRLRR